MKENQSKITEAAHDTIEITKVLVKDDDEKNRLLAAGNDYNFVTNVDDILSDDSIDIVAHVMAPNAWTWDRTRAWRQEHCS